MRPAHRQLFPGYGTDYVRQIPRLQYNHIPMITPRYSATSHCCFRPFISLRERIFVFRNSRCTAAAFGTPSVLIDHGPRRPLITAFHAFMKSLYRRWPVNSCKIFFNVLWCSHRCPAEAAIFVALNIGLSAIRTDFTFHSRSKHPHNPSLISEMSSPTGRILRMSRQ